MLRDLTTFWWNAKPGYWAFLVWLVLLFVSPIFTIIGSIVVAFAALFAFGFWRILKDKKARWYVVGFITVEAVFWTYILIHHMA